MPENVRTYLQRCQGQVRRRLDSEAEAALACLPKQTKVFQYESASQMEAAANNVDAAEGGYSVFLNVPKGGDGPDQELVSIGRTSYFPASRILISRMLTIVHHIAVSWFDYAILSKVIGLGMSWEGELECLGAATVRGIHKQPDLRLQPVNLPAGRSDEWPTLVVEVGNSKSQTSLDLKTRRWLQASNGDVEIVITKITRTRFTVRRWALAGRTRAHPTIMQTISITRRSQQDQRPSRITGSLLTTPFVDLFLRNLLETRQISGLTRLSWGDGRVVLGEKFLFLSFKGASSTGICTLYASRGMCSAWE